MIAPEMIHPRIDPTLPVRPVLTRDEALAIGRRVLELSHGGIQAVRLEHRVTGITRISRVRRTGSADREVVQLGIVSEYGGKASVSLSTNQLDDATLKVAVPYLERVARTRLGSSLDIWRGLFDKGPRSHLPVELWHESTVEALADVRTEKLSAILDATQSANLRSSIFAGAAARALCYVHADGLTAYGQETDAEISVTCWTSDGKGSGWGGVASRNWTTLDPLEATQTAIDIAQRSTTIHALEPGRYTTILGRTAVAQLMTGMDDEFNAHYVYDGITALTAPGGTSKVGQRVFDARISLRSDPADPDGGYFPFVMDGQWNTNGLPVVPMTWVDHGVLKHLAYEPNYAAQRGMSLVADPPRSIRVEATAPHATVEEMIAACKRGIYVNRFSGISRDDQASDLLTGVTRDGCFLVVDGKINRAIKNFFFRASPFFAWNALEMVGESRRAAMGYTPNNGEWPSPPIIAPPMMVTDFNFFALADAV